MRFLIGDSHETIDTVIPRMLSGLTTYARAGIRPLTPLISRVTMGSAR